MKPRTKPNFSRTTWTTGTRQLVVQLALEMTWCFAGSYAVWLTPKTMGMSSFLAGGEVLGRLVAIGEPAGGLEHQLHPEVLPRQGRRVLLREHLDGPPVDVDPVRRRLHRAGRSEERRVGKECR